MKRFILFVGLCCSTSSIIAQKQTQTAVQQQILTNEDSLHLGGEDKKTVISGYGSAYYQHNFNKNIQRSTASLERIVLFVGHRFNERISFFSEMELENALVAGMERKGEIAMEQAYLKFTLNPKTYIVAGLFLPRIGILNENHLPVNFNGVERTMVETYIIPSTWRELGVGLYASVNPYLNYSVALLNGLNSAAFNSTTGIGGGKGEGSLASSNNLALTAAVQYRKNYFSFQASGYAGGTVGLSSRGADSLGLDSGPFGTPVFLGEMNARYNDGAFSFTVLGSYIAVPDAEKINLAYAKNMGSSMYGAYAELGYNWFNKKETDAQLISFARYEMLNMNLTIPEVNALYDGTLEQKHLILGIGYLPVPQVVVKVDVRLMQTGDLNKALLINPPPNMLPYQKNSTLLNIGIGYSF